jgi:DNA repair exonuclease SbcCD ATPase subunit
MAASELRSSLQSLSDRSLKTSRRLDDTYYSILEKVSVLRQTIGSLQELSGLTKELHENFETDTTELVEEIQGQFEGFNDFKAQEEQVRELEDRVKAGKEKADALTARLATARERVAARAEADAEWEATTSRTLLYSPLTCSTNTNVYFRTPAHALGHRWYRHCSSASRCPLPTTETRGCKQGRQQ